MRRHAQPTYISTKDFSVSGESFDLIFDEKTNILKTNPQPQGSDLNKYYESDDYISHTDAKNTPIEKLYHLVRRYALYKKCRLIKRQSKKSKGRILDIGSGTGDFLKAMQLQNWETTGFEPNDKARSISQNKGIELAINLSDLPDHTFDVITMWHVLEHVQDLSAQILQLKRLLKPKGVLIIAVPNYKSFDANYYGQFWAAYDVPRHLWHFSKNTISILFSEVDLKVKKTIPMYFDSFYVSLLSEKYKTGKMNFFSGFAIGLLSNLKGIRSGEFSSHIYVLKS